MKKKILGIILTIAVIFSLVMVPGGKIEAASGYPSIKARKSQYSGVVGSSSIACVYDITYGYFRYEKLVLEVYDKSGKMVANQIKNFDSTDSEIKKGPKNDIIEYSLEIPDNYPTGTVLKIVAKMKYSTDGGMSFVNSQDPVNTTFEVIKKGTGHTNEWYDGYWYDENGVADYNKAITWKGSGNIWWIEDSSGWYPKDEWLKIDGNWYYFTSEGYMDYSEYREGYWLNADGTCSSTYIYGTWRQDSTGWWYEDAGWYPVNQYLWIDGTQYWFNESGYMM